MPCSVIPSLRQSPGVCAKVASAGPCGLLYSEAQRVREADGKGADYRAGEGLAPGVRVRVKGLTGRDAGLNGAEGRVVAWKARAQCWQVDLTSGDAREVKAENLVLAPQGEADAAVFVAKSPRASVMTVQMGNYEFFVKYTYSRECALLAYNFHEMVCELGIFEAYPYRHDDRLVSISLAYMFYRYQVHHCDMALDLALTLTYLEDLGRNSHQELGSANALDVICYFTFLAHTFNTDRAIRLSDWYKDIGCRSFHSCRQLDAFVFLLFSKVRRFRLRSDEKRLKGLIRRLCSVPQRVDEAA